MLRVIVQYLPGGSEARAKEILRADVENISDLAPTSDYLVAVTGPDIRTKYRVLDHKRRHGAPELLRRVFAVIAGKEPAGT